jgi:hypothetical protein
LEREKGRPRRRREKRCGEERIARDGKRRDKMQRQYGAWGTGLSFWPAAGVVAGEW